MLIEMSQKLPPEWYSAIEEKYKSEFKIKIPDLVTEELD